MATPETPSIPSTARLPTEVRIVVEPMKEQLETMSAKRPKVDKIAKLGASATTAQIITKINEILDRLQS